MMLTVDLETHKAEGEEGQKPDFRTDLLERVGWLEEGAETAKWAGCWCPLPKHDTWLCHNGSYDAGIAYREGLRPQIEDTLALAYCQGEEDLSLKGLAQKYLGVQTVSYSQQEMIGPDQYHAQDLWLTQRLFPILREKQRGTCYDIDRALIPALIDCSYRGYEIDQDRLEQAIQKSEGVVLRTAASFDRLVAGSSVLHSRRKKTTKKAGVEYIEAYGPPGITSPLQLQRYFGAKSVDKKFLEETEKGEGEQALAAFLRHQWVTADKLLTTYFYPNRGKSKLTGLFNITPSEEGEGSTQTGRLSSERANMQNQPDAMQRCLRAPEGMLLLRGDYPSIELRCAAEISDDEYLLQAFAEGRDIHEETRVALGLDSRVKAKNFNFGAGLYGGGANYVSQVVGRPIREVESLMARHRSLWVDWWKFTARHWQDVQRTGRSVSPEPFFHVRPISLLGGDKAYKQAINHPTQSMAGYITKAAMVRLFQEGWLLVNQVHDAIHAYIPEDGNIPLLKQQFKSIMESTAKEYLPRIGAAPVEVKCSKYWEDGGLL